jgi:hypothetical protein
MNDCANFGSQILVAGGIKKKKGTGKKNYADPTRWYAGTGGGSRAWEQAHYLYKYLTEKKKFGKKIMTRSQALRTNTKSGYVEYWKDAEVGDIIFWMRADGKVGHTTFVTFSTPLTNKAETGTRLAAHTGSHYKAYFSYFWKNLSWKKAIRVHPERD